MRRVAMAAAIALALFGATQVAAAAWIHVKAILAQQLIAASWRRAREGGPAPTPWRWADMHPVARLTVPAHDVDLYVLDDASGRSLAFGPGLVSGSAPPGSAGNMVLVAHRDTHFAFLKSLAAGDEIDLQATRGAVVRYRVRQAGVVDRDDTAVMSETGEAQLTLITCYPFDAVRPGTRWRYVVVAAPL